MEQMEQKEQARLLRAEDLAKRLGVCRATVWGWAKRKPGFPAAIKLSARVTVWNAAEIDEWVAQHRAGA